MMEHKLNGTGTVLLSLTAGAPAPTALPGTHKTLSKEDDHPQPEKKYLGASVEPVLGSIRATTNPHVMIPVHSGSLSTVSKEGN